MSLRVILSAAALVCVSVTLANISVRRGGWLDRLVEYHKEQFLNEIEKEAPIQINVTIQSRPPGYEDSSSWNYESVIRLLTLIRDSESAAPVRTALRQALRPTRRFMSRLNSFKHFPSLALKSPNYFYYPVLSDELYNHDSSVEGTTLMLRDDDVVYISNPVEARLPSGHIAVKLLKEIMEERAFAARIMPTTPKPTFIWIPKSTVQSSDSIEGGQAEAEGESSNNETAT